MAADYADRKLFLMRESTLPQKFSWLMPGLLKEIKIFLEY